MGRLLPLPNEPDKMMGRIGRMQGEMMRASPSKKARLIFSVSISRNASPFDKIDP